MKPEHNIGGSLLASSAPHIFQPIPSRSGVLQVVEDRAADTHHLLLDERVVASHPNGFSCHALALAIADEDHGWILRQAVYIAQCGGQLRTDRLSSIMSSQPTQPQ